MYIGSKFKFKLGEICNHLGVSLDANIISPNTTYTISSIVHPHLTIHGKYFQKSTYHIKVKEFIGTIYENTSIPSYYIETIEDNRDGKINSILE